MASRLSFHFEYDHEGYDDEQLAVVDEVTGSEFRQCIARILERLEEHGLSDVQVDEWTEGDNDP